MLFGIPQTEHKWYAVGTTGNYVREIEDGIYYYPNSDKPLGTTAWAVDKFLEISNYDYESWKRNIISDIVYDLPINRFVEPAITEVITSDEKTLRTIAQDLNTNGYHGLAKKFAILAISLKDTPAIEQKGLYGILRLEGEELVGYYVSKSVFDKMRLNGTGNEPALD